MSGNATIAELCEKIEIINANIFLLCEVKNPIAKINITVATHCRNMFCMNKIVGKKVKKEKKAYDGTLILWNE